MRTVRLGDVCRIVGGGTPSKSTPGYWGGDIPWVSPKDMRTRRILDTQDHLTEAGVAGSTTQLIPEGSVLVVARSGVLANRVPVALTGRPVTVNQDMKALIPPPDLDPEFLYWFVRSQEKRLLRNGVKRGATVQSLRTDVLADLNVPLADLESQRFIVERMRRLATAQDWREQTRLRLHELRSALFQRHVGDHARAGTVPTVPLGELARVIRGASPRPKGDPRFFGGPIPWIKIGDLPKNSDVLLLTTEGVTEAGAARSVIVEPGTVLLSNSASVGTPVILGVRGCIHDGWLAFLDVSPRIDRDYLFLALKASRQALVRAAPTGTQANLNTTIVKGFEIPVPSLSEQRMLVKADAAVSEALALSVEQQSRMVSLEGSLLGKSFDLHSIQ